MSNRRRHAADRGHAILTPRSLFQGANARKVLESDHHAARLSGFAGQRSDAEPQSQRQSVGCETVSMEARTYLSSCGCVHRIGYLVRHVAKKDRSVLAANLGRLVTSNLFSGCIESEDATLQVSGNEP